MGKPDFPALAAFASRHYGVVTLARARDFGLSRRQVGELVQSGQWIHLYENVYLVATTRPYWKGNLLAACWAGGFRAVASHRSAAALWGLAGGRRNIVEITCPRWRRSRHEGLVVHESKALGWADITIVDEVPTTTPEVTLLGLAAVCHESVVEMALDRAENVGLVTEGSVRAMLKRLGRPGRNGAGRLRRLLDLHEGRLAVPDSEMETRVFQLLRRNGFPEPVPQFEVRVGGRFVAKVDAAYPELKIAIEYDSDEHHTGREKLARDNERRNRLWAVDWFPVTATHHDVRNGGPQLCAALRGARRRAS
jgi:hypothetical protein